MVVYNIIGSLRAHDFTKQHVALLQTLDAAIRLAQGLRIIQVCELTHHIHINASQNASAPTDSRAHRKLGLRLGRHSSRFGSLREMKRLLADTHIRLTHQVLLHRCRMTTLLNFLLSVEGR